MHLVSPPTILHKHCLQFLLGPPKYTEEITDKGYEKLWEKTRRIMGDMQMTNKAAKVHIVWGTLARKFTIVVYNNSE